MIRGKKRTKIIAAILSAALAVTSLNGTAFCFSDVTYAAEADQVSIERVGNGLKIYWDAIENASSYDVYRAKSRYGTYSKISTVTGTSYLDNAADEDDYSNYYKVAAAGSETLSDPISLEIEMFGKDMYVFSPNDDLTQVEKAIDDVYQIQGDVDEEGTAGTGQQFGDGRYAFAFKTGDDSAMPQEYINMSYYMQLLGLGKVPNDVILNNVHVPPVLPNNNVTCNFWMGIENLTISENTTGSNDAWFDFMWSVSQAAPAQGCTGVTAEDLYALESGLGKTNWKSGKTYTILDNTDIIREKPFLYFDEDEKEYKVFVPGLRDNAASINAALTAGKEIEKEAPSVDNNEKTLEEEENSNSSASDEKKYYPIISDQTTATGTYADWKNNAITYPVKSQLVASGLFDIKFTSLDAAVSYEVYIDNKLVKTFTQSDANQGEFAVEVKNIEVKKHTTFVVATLADGEKVTSNIRSFFISKKGMGIWQADSDKIAEENLAWYYTWSPYELEGVSENVEFVPMIWGDEADSRSIDRQNEWKWLRDGNYKAYKYLLTFNEPDFTDQSHMTPERAVELWPELEAISDAGTVVSSPCVAIPTVFYDSAENEYGVVGGWFGKYEQLMATYDYHDDFTAVHLYFDYPGDYVLDIFEQIYEKTGKPLWITEWGVGQWTQVQNFDWTGGPDEDNWQRQIVVDFMKDVLPKMDQLDFVERYAWFPFDGSNTDKYGNGAGGLFFCGEDDPQKGELTAVGKVYRDYGNPAGYDANNPVADLVAEDERTGEMTPDPIDPEPPVDPELPGDEEEPVNPGDEETSDEVVNVLAGKTATASSVVPGNTADKAIDEDANSRWESVHAAEGNQWIAVDLDGLYTVDAYKIVWETAAAKTYRIQVSEDNQNWTDWVSVTEGASCETKEESVTPALARYIRVLCEEKTTQYGYSIYSFVVEGKLGDHISSKDDEDNGENTEESGGNTGNTSGGSENGTGTPPTIVNPPSLVNKTFIYKNYKYKILSSKVGSYTVMMLGSTKKKLTSVTVPSTVKYQNQRYKVVAVGNNAFKNNKRIKRVTIGKYVTSIGKSAFYNCRKLSRVTFKGSKLTKVGSKAFLKTSSKLVVHVTSKGRIAKMKKLLKKKVPGKTKIVK